MRFPSPFLIQVVDSIAASHCVRASKKIRHGKPVVVVDNMLTIAAFDAAYVAEAAKQRRCTEPSCSERDEGIGYVLAKDALFCELSNY